VKGEQLRQFWKVLRQPLSSRAGFAAVLTAVVVGALALMGGLGHTSIGGSAASAAEYQYNPTSKDQCKNGGWASFSGFKNQGDCVSYVATGGKNPPG
jgi:hypothetical protein